MKQVALTEMLLYRYRYVVGFILFLSLLIGTLLVSLQVPAQLNNAERESALTSATLSLQHPLAHSLIDLPYHLLQKASLHFFGVTTFAIKLPSLLIGGISALLLVWLLRQWLLRTSIAILAGIIAVTTPQFLSLTQTGTPAIMMIFWVVILLVLALKLTANHRSFLWVLCFCLAVGLGLYTPLTIYILLGLLVAGMLHPHLRYILRSLSLTHVMFGILLALILLIPLIVGVVKDVSELAYLAGWPEGIVSSALIRYNFKELIKSYLLVWRPDMGALGLTPVFGIPSLVLMIFGGLKLLADHHAARSYALALLLPVLAIVIILQPTSAAILFVPLILLLALGIETLLGEWYKLFPHNPYARVTALVPMTILLLGIVLLNINYYTSGYTHSPRLANYYNRDLDLAHQTLSKYPKSTILTNQSTEQFYDLLRRDYPEVKVGSLLAHVKNTNTLVISPGVDIANKNLGKLVYLATDEYQEREPRFFVYQPPTARPNR